MFYKGTVIFLNHICTPCFSYFTDSAATLGLFLYFFYLTSELTFVYRTFIFRLLSLAIRLSNSFSIFWLPKAGTTAVLTKE